MEYFAGLDISMKETHICVMDREGKVALEAKAATSASAIAVELAKAPAARRIVFWTHGDDAVSRSCGIEPARSVYREPARLPSTEVSSDAQD